MARGESRQRGTANANTGVDTISGSADTISGTSADTISSSSADTIRASRGQSSDC